MINEHREMLTYSHGVSISVVCLSQVWFKWNFIRFSLSCFPVSFKELNNTSASETYLKYQEMMVCSKYIDHLITTIESSHKIQNCISWGVALLSPFEMLRWMSNVRPGNRILAWEFMTKLKLYSMREYLQGRSLQWFGLLDGTKKNVGSSNSQRAT